MISLLRMGTTKTFIVGILLYQLEKINKNKIGMATTSAAKGACTDPSSSSAVRSRENDLKAPGNGKGKRSSAKWKT
jgi:hypothetical protein